MNYQDKLSYINNLLNENGHRYFNLNETETEFVYELYKNGIELTNFEKIQNITKIYSCYARYYAIKFDFDKRDFYLQKCSELGCPSCLNYLGFIEMNEKFNIETAKFLYHKSLDNKYPSAAYNLSIIYEYYYNDIDMADKLYQQYVTLAEEIRETAPWAKLIALESNLTDAFFRNKMDEIYYDVALFYMRRKRYGEALCYIQKANHLSKGKYNTKLLELYLKLNMYHLIEQYFDNQETKLFDFYLKKGLYKKAISYLKSTDSEYYLKLGELYEKMGRFTEAVAFYQNAKESGVKLKIADIYLKKLSDWPNAEKYYLQYLQYKDSKTCIEIYHKIADHFTICRNDVIVEKYLLKAYKKYNNIKSFEKLIHHFLITIKNKKKFEEYLQECLVVTNVESPNAMLMCYLGYYYLTYDDKNKGFEYFEKCFNLDEELVYIDVAVFYTDNHDLACEYLKKGLTKSKKINSKQRYLLCLGIMNMEKDKELAKKYYLSAIKFGCADSEFLYIKHFHPNDDTLIYTIKLYLTKNITYRVDANALLLNIYYRKKAWKEIIKLNCSKFNHKYKIIYVVINLKNKIKELKKMA